MCKFLATTVAEATASKCVNWMGGNGITEQVQSMKKAFVHLYARILNHAYCSTWLKSITEMPRFCFPCACVRYTPAVTLRQVGQIYEGTSNIQLQTIANLLQHEYKRS